MYQYSYNKCQYALNILFSCYPIAEKYREISANETAKYHLM